MEALAAELERWRGFLAAEQSPDIVRRTAELLAGGAWSAGCRAVRSSARAPLGNRSVLADPRPAENRARLDAALRRPAGSVAVGPAVLEEAAGGLFELPEGTASFPYMAFALQVREAGRPALRPAALSADGTAWLQTVSDETNPRFWELLRAFRDLTGVPALLNTSFRSHTEPIVDSVEDAVVAFLTTELDYLVVGDFMVERRTPSRADRLSLRLSLPPYVRLQQTRRFVGPERMAAVCQIRTTYDSNLGVPISRPLYELLMGLEGERALSEILPASGDAAAEEALLSELDKLWAQRLVRLRGGGGEAAR